MPPILCHDGESAASESSFDIRDSKTSESFSRRVRFDECRNRFNWIESFVDFRSDLWYNRADYDEIMEDNWDIVDLHREGDFRESDDDTYRGLEPLSQDKPYYMSAVFAVIQEQERLIRTGAYCEEKISQASLVMSREDKRIALKHAENDYISVYGKSKLSRSTSDKSTASTLSSSSLSSSSLGAPSKTTGKVYVSPIGRVKRLLSPKRSKMLVRAMPQGIIPSL